MFHIKIAFISTHLTIYGGAGVFLMTYANLFAEEGHEITIIAQKIDKSKYHFHPNIKLIEIGGVLPSNPIYWITMFWIKKKYVREISKLDVNILFPQFFPVNFFCLDANPSNNSKVIYYCHEPFRFFYDKEYIKRSSLSMRVISFGLRIFFKRFDQFAGKNVDQIACNSNFIAGQIKKIYQRKAFVHTTFPSIPPMQKDFNLRQKLKIKPLSPILFTLGLSSHMKGAEEMMYIFGRILKKNKDTVLIIGGSIEKNNLKIIISLKRYLKIQDENLILLGFIPDDELGAYYGQSTVVIYTALYESFGLVPIESLYYSTPVVAFEGGPSETIIEAKSGFVVKNGDIDSFTNRVIQLIENPKLRNQFGNFGHNYVVQNFTRDKSLGQLRSFFSDTLAFTGK